MYCCGTGSSRCSTCFSAAMAVLDAPGPSMVWTGSEGDAFCSPNSTAVRTSRMTTTAPRRLTMSCIMTWLLSAVGHEVADTVAGNVGRKGQQRDGNAWHHRDPPVLQQIAQVAGSVGTQLRCRRLRTEAEEG